MPSKRLNMPKQDDPSRIADPTTPATVECGAEIDIKSDESEVFTFACVERQGHMSGSRPRHRHITVGRKPGQSRREHGTPVEIIWRD